MRRAGTVLTLLLVSGLAIGLVASCVAHSTAAVPGHRHGPPAVAATVPPATTVTAAATGGFNATDTAWLQLMIPMDERTLPLLDLGTERGHDPAVRRLAARIREAHLAELQRLRETLGRTGLPPTNVHEGHDMPGMVTAADLTALRAATGPSFDRLFAGHLREHLDQSSAVARSEQTAGADGDTRALAAAVERTRAAQRDLLAGIR
ncbi:uncharacterized protein (DUF305 family) [Streptosporangium album]|uniref:Uncharacterized protein (DUF305 family) n=1 Tax=Streptosporangium album TaxID=47479 RepID=A0A7W7RTZ9_9ACTN|nr:DUF305 domain-containing protein [Streptosporangium album]MBB4938199.1 uncharacterized protein (DUF305 family) [Streptosporangium album]